MNELRQLKKEANLSFEKEIDFAFKIIEHCKTINVEEKAQETVDESLIRVSKDLDAVVATNDSELRKRLRSKHISVVYLKQCSFLVLEGYIN
jgi:rRNA-processing protein FCF1